MRNLDEAESLGIAASRYHRWKNQSGMSTQDEVRRLRERGTENVRLKLIVAERFFSSCY